MPIMPPLDVTSYAVSIRLVSIELAAAAYAAATRATLLIRRRYASTKYGASLLPLRAWR